MSAANLEYQSRNLFSTSLIHLNSRIVTNREEDLTALADKIIIGITAAGSAIAATTSWWPLSLAAPVVVLKVFGLDLIRSAFGQKTLPQPDPANVAFTAKVDEIQNVLKRYINNPDRICKLFEQPFVRLGRSRICRSFV